ncbi:MAG: hypothetical protein WDO24_23950 [Pseudomonadota bacterium]
MSSSASLTPSRCSSSRRPAQLPAFRDADGRPHPLYRARRAGRRKHPDHQAGGMENSLSAWNYSYEVAAPENMAFDAAIVERHKLHPVFADLGGLRPRSHGCAGDHGGGQRRAGQDPRWRWPISASRA